MKNIPNILSAFRIVLIPFFIYCFCKDDDLAAAIVLGASGITDTLDGFLARRFNWITQIGKMLDPFADKLTQITVSIIFMIRYPEFWTIFTVLLLKEVVMIILGGLAVKDGVKVQGSKWFGKVATCIFYFTMVGLLFIPAILDVAVTSKILTVLFAANLVLAVCAALMYIPDYRTYRINSKTDKNSGEKQ